MVRNSHKLYNHEQKVRFLEEEYPNDNTRQTYASALISVAKFEKDKNKDLCDFSYNDVVDLMIGLKKKTYKSLDVSQTIMVKYVDWAIREGYNQTGLNAFKLLSKDDLKKYTHKIAEKKSYITRERLYEIADALYNPIDKAILVLLFEGVRGRAEIENTFEELRNLKMSDVHPITNTIDVTKNNGLPRTIKVDERTMNILLRAIDQDEYYYKNGTATGKFKSRLLKGTNYVIRTIDVENGYDGDKVSSQSICTKLIKFRQWTGVSFLNPTLVFQSGLLERCEELEELYGELEPDHYKLVYRELELDDRIWYSLKELYESYKQNKALK